MNSPARAAASRANAKRSTGPRTAAGKAKVAGNARRHGLWVAGFGLDAGEARELAGRIAGQIGGTSATAIVEAAALDVACAILELRKVRRHRAALTEAAFADDKATDFAALVGDLARLDRYERRARTHRRNAIRALDGLCTGRSDGTKPNSGVQ